MKTEDISKAKEFAYQFWALEKDFIKIVPRSAEREWIKRLVVLEDKPLEHRSETEQWEIEAIMEKLAEVPPYRKVSYPIGPHQPVRAPRNDVERAVQNERHVRHAQFALECFATQMGLDRHPQPVTFRVVDGYRPMMERAAKALMDQRPRPSLAQRVKTFFRRLFSKPAVRRERQVETRADGVSVASLTAEYRRLSREELMDHLDAVLAATESAYKE